MATKAAKASRGDRKLSQTQKRRAVDVALTRLNNAEAAASTDATPEQVLEVRRLKTALGNAKIAYRVAGGSPTYTGTIVERMATK